MIPETCSRTLTKSATTCVLVAALATFLLTGGNLGAQAPARQDRTEDIQTLIGQLAKSTYSNSDEIVDKIVKLGNLATMPLLETLQDNPLRTATVDCRSVLEALGSLRDRRAVPKLIEILNWKIGDHCVDWAMRALGEIGDPRAVDPLIEELRKKNTWPAAEALGQLKDRRAIEPLLAALDHDINDSVTEALIGFGAPAVATARAGMKSSDANLRRNSLRFLSLHNHITTASELAPLLRDESPEVRTEAVEALGRLRAASVTSLIFPLISDPDSNVRFSAATVLFHKGDRRGVDTLVTELLSRFTTADEKYEKFEIVSLMTEVGDKRTLDALIESLDHRESGVREEAAQGLGKIGGEKAVSALLEHLADWEISKASAAALTKLKWMPRSTEEKIHFLIAGRDGPGLRTNWTSAKTVLLNDVASGDPSVVESAVFTIIGLGRTELVPELIPILDAKGTRTIAEVYLNSGNKELESAARAWAQKRGYSIGIGGSSRGVRWGGF
jgi:HEAT repeat protein